MRLCMACVLRLRVPQPVIAPIARSLGVATDFLAHPSAVGPAWGGAAMAQRPPLARYFFIASVDEETCKPQARWRPNALGPAHVGRPARPCALRGRVTARASAWAGSWRALARVCSVACAHADVLTLYGCPRCALSLRRC